jgi:transcriptional regulator with XRE-family HTH domain
MKLKVGNKLLAIREERKINQTDMAELLSMSISAYQRLERSETFANYEQVMAFSKILEVPIQEFLPDNITISTRQDQNGHIGLVMGNIYNYGDKELTTEIEKLRLQLSHKDEKISLLETTITDLRNTVAVLQKEK